jgi:hypothetical protein
MKVFFCCVLLVLLSTAYSQDAYQPTKVIPPSPTAASLGAYGDIPISFYTGAANISIPLYSIKTNQHNLPITLQYSSSGLKVAQDASWVGLGWSLNAGGVVTRSIRGQDDFSLDGYINSGKLPPYDENNDHLISYDDDSAYAYLHYFLDITQSHTKDGDPDIYYYNFGNYSGKFLIGKAVDGKPIFMADRNDLLVKYNADYADTISSLGGEWIITTPDGLQYYFSIPEVSEDYTKNGTLSSYSGLTPNFTRSYKEIANSWYLRKIKSPAGEEVVFTYERGKSLSLINVSQTRYDRTSSVSASGGGGVTMFNTYKYDDLSRQVIYDVILKKIEFKTGYLVFNTSRRSDIEPFPSATEKPQKLSSIEMYDNNDNLQKKFVFKYNYFNRSRN